MIPVAAATMTPLPLLLALIVMKVRDYCMQRSKIPMMDDDESGHEHQNSGSIIKIMKEEVKESESKIKLVNSAGDPVMEA